MKTREAPTEEVLLALGYRSVSYAVTNIFTALRGLTCRDGATRYLHGIGTRRDCFQCADPAYASRMRSVVLTWRIMLPGAVVLQLCCRVRSAVHGRERPAGDEAGSGTTFLASY
eukprot:3544447-Rhodomonas_salina.1